jgi:hypothetical protein
MLEEEGRKVKVGGERMDRCVLIEGRGKPINRHSSTHNYVSVPVGCVPVSGLCGRRGDLASAQLRRHRHRPDPTFTSLTTLNSIPLQHLHFTSSTTAQLSATCPGESESLSHRSGARVLTSLRGGYVPVGVFPTPQPGPGTCIRQSSSGMRS